MEIKRHYIVDVNNRRIAVQLDLKTFEKIEEILENYGLVQLMSAEEEDEPLNLAEAKAYYKKTIKLNETKI
jgi:hypothetical protein